MAELASQKILRTFSGDSYGNIVTQDEPSEMNCDEDKTKDDGNGTQDSNKELKNDIVSTSDLDLDQPVKDLNENLTDGMDSSGEQCINEHFNKGELNSVEEENSVPMKEDELTDKDHDQSSLNVINDDDEENQIMKDEEENQIMINENNHDDENANSQLNLEENLGNVENGDINTCNEESKENLSLSDNEAGNMDDFDRSNLPVKKLHSIHLTPEALCEGTVEDTEGQSQLSLFDGDDGERELSPMYFNANLTSARSDNRPQTTSTTYDVPGGLRAKANTPASYYNANELDTPKSANEKTSARASSRQSRDEVFHRAMTLMSNRCTSARGEEENNLLSSREPPFGIHIPQYFYVHQKKPQPLAPLKAWRGYKGNVYFEPMNIQRLKDNENFDDPRPPPSRGTLRSAPVSQSRNSNFSRGLSTSSSTSRPYCLVNSSKQIYVLDKTMLVSASTSVTASHFHFDDGLESTGSLTVAQPSLSKNRHSNQQLKKDKRLLHKRDRICKGPNFHKPKDKSEIANNRNNRFYALRISEPMKKLITPDNSRRTSGTASKMSMRNQIANENANSKLKKGNQSKSALIVNGDKLASQPQVASPVDYSTHPLTKRRVTMEDVDAYVSASDNLNDLHHVGQVRVPLDHITAELDSFRGTSPCSDNASNDGEGDASGYMNVSFKGLTTSIPVDTGY